MRVLLNRWSVLLLIVLWKRFANTYILLILIIIPIGIYSKPNYSEESARSFIDLSSLWDIQTWSFRNSHPEVFLIKGVLKACSKFTGEKQSQSANSINLQNSFIEITVLHGCSPVNLLYIFRTPFLKSTSGLLLLKFLKNIKLFSIFIFNYGLYPTCCFKTIAFYKRYRSNFHYLGNFIAKTLF